MSGRGFCRAGIAVLMALLVGCAGNVITPDPQPELQSFPEDVDLSSSRENIQLPTLTSSSAVTTRAPVLLNVDFKAVEDESLDLNHDGPLRIYLRTESAPDKHAESAPGMTAP